MCNIPLVFSLCCQKIVILTGRGTELSSTRCPLLINSQQSQALMSVSKVSVAGDAKPAPPCVCIPWDKHTTTLNFSQVLGSISVSQYIARYEPPVLTKWDTASREYIQLRIAGSTAGIVISQQARNMCCMCRINAVQNKYTLLDIYNHSMVIVSVCSKHSLPPHLSSTVLTVSDYIDTIHLRAQR